MTSLYLVYVLRGQVRGNRYGKYQNLACILAYGHTACNVLRLGKQTSVRAQREALLIFVPLLCFTLWDSIT